MVKKYHYQSETILGPRFESVGPDGKDGVTIWDTDIYFASDIDQILTDARKLADWVADVNSSRADEAINSDELSDAASRIIAAIAEAEEQEAGSENDC
jgi:hypothetical protein